MNTEYLREFVCLAETRNFWEASERLYMNQSTLSKHIKSLETDLGVKLFMRTTRRVELTGYGETFLPFARQITHAEFEGTSAIRRLLNIENGLLTIGTIPSMAQYHITHLLAQFQKQYPGTSVRITEDDPNQLLRYLDDNSCELIFNREDRAAFEKNFLYQPQITRIPYIRDHLVALFPITHPLASESSITLQQLKDEKFCLIKEGTLMYQLAMEACQNAGFIPDVIFTSHRIDSILDMVTGQNCAALLMDMHLSLPENRVRQNNAPWTTVKILPEVASQISLCYRADKPLSAAAKRFVDFCTEKIFHAP